MNTLIDWENRVKNSLSEFSEDIEVRTYAYMARHYTDMSPAYYNYLVVDDERVIIRTKLEKPSKIKGLALI